MDFFDQDFDFCLIFLFSLFLKTVTKVERISTNILFFINNLLIIFVTLCFFFIILFCINEVSQYCIIELLCLKYYYIYYIQLSCGLLVFNLAGFSNDYRDCHQSIK